MIWGCDWWDVMSGFGGGLEGRAGGGGGGVATGGAERAVAGWGWRVLAAVRAPVARERSVLGFFFLCVCVRLRVCVCALHRLGSGSGP